MNDATMLYAEISICVHIKVIDYSIIMNEIRNSFKKYFTTMAFYDARLLHCSNECRNIWMFEIGIPSKELQRMKLLKYSLYQFIFSGSHYMGKYESFDYYANFKLGGAN